MTEPDYDAGAEEYIYDIDPEQPAGLVIREIVPNMIDSGPAKCFREKASDDLTGWTVWASAVLLARWAMANPSVFAGKTVLELGAGCGLSGLAVAACTPAAAVTLNDYDQKTVDNMLHNIARNCEAVVEDGTASGTRGIDPSNCTAAERAQFVHVKQRWRHRRTGCEVAVTQMDWDVEDTWPTEPGPDGKPQVWCEPSIFAMC
jgi:hypothetical protein